jgi:hypothetical protein
MIPAYKWLPASYAIIFLLVLLVSFFKYQGLLMSKPRKYGYFGLQAFAHGPRFTLLGVGVMIRQLALAESPSVMWNAFLLFCVLFAADLFASFLETVYHSGTASEWTWSGGVLGLLVPLVIAFVSNLYVYSFVVSSE